ncbi:glycoside hydrolase family 43 protein [Xylariaceae sp. FL1272]|nr:glycoside hydrolase family 43 protein [Xylariaceae sp. FL1272]
MKLLQLCLGLLPVVLGTTVSPTALSATNSTYYNPILPGWHSDPSCVRVEDIFFCVTSTFISFPGLPIYASKDLLNWKLVSHAWNRDSQIPGASWNTSGQQEGMYAATIRHHDSVFYVICEYLGALADGNLGVVFKTLDPFNETTWSDAVTFITHNIDSDLFWDDDGKVYMATQTVDLQEIDLETGALTDPINIWNGTGGVWPEGPHIYKKDGYYYLMIAEGGTELGHSVTIARSRNITGPYEAYEHNPILTNRNTTEYFQTVGHADLFQDSRGNWWGVALATRSGPDWEIYPMGREAVLYPVTWDEGEWPILEPVRGVMNGWALPPRSRDLPGEGPFNSDDDVYDFAEGTDIPRNLVYWRVPREGVFTIGKNGLQIVPSRANLRGVATDPTLELTGQRGLSFIGRRQTDTLFTFSFDVSFAPTLVGQETGITVFLTQNAHIDLGLVLLGSNSTYGSHLSLRFQGQGTGIPPPPKTVPVPSDWNTESIRLKVRTLNTTHYSFSAAPARHLHKEITMGVASAALVSGGDGPFTGSLVGAYATCSGAGLGDACPEGANVNVKRWRYTGIAQYITETVSLPEGFS